MPIAVDIADRLYDYTDEENAADAVASYQSELGFNDKAILEIWANEADPRRFELERRIFEAVDLNGSAKRAAENVPGGVSLFIDESVN